MNILFLVFWFIVNINTICMSAAKPTTSKQTLAHIAALATQQPLCPVAPAALPQQVQAQSHMDRKHHMDNSKTNSKTASEPTTPSIEHPETIVLSEGFYAAGTLFMLSKESIIKTFKLLDESKKVKQEKGAPLAINKASTADTGKQPNPTLQILLSPSVANPKKEEAIAKLKPLVFDRIRQEYPVFPIACHQELVDQEVEKQYCAPLGNAKWQISLETRLRIELFLCLPYFNGKTAVIFGIEMVANNQRSHDQILEAADIVLRDYIKQEIRSCHKRCYNRDIENSETDRDYLELCDAFYKLKIDSRPDMRRFFNCGFRTEVIS